MKKRINNVPLLLCGIGMIAFLASGCGSESGQEAAGGDNEPRPASNEVRLTAQQMASNGFKEGGFTLRQFHHSIKANGMLDVPPENSVAISAYFGGYVKELKLLPGQSVQKGQELLVLENPEFIQLQQDYLEAQGQLRYLQSDYERQSALVKGNVASEKKYLKAESDYLVMKARYEALSKKLSMLGIDAEKMKSGDIVSSVSIKAPIAGYVSSILAEKGMFLAPSDIALTLVNTRHIHLELNVFEKDVMEVAEGQEVIFHLQDNPTVEYQGKVHLVGKTVAEEDRSIRVHVHITDEEKLPNLVPGMYAEAVIRTETNESEALPESAVVKEGEAEVVLVKVRQEDSDEVFSKRKVIVGKTEGGYVEVQNAADFGKDASFLLSGAFNLIAE